VILNDSRRRLYAILAEGDQPQDDGEDEVEA